MSLTENLKRWFWFLALFGALVLSMGGDSVSASGPELERFVRSAVGKFILSETQQGAEILSRSVGKGTKITTQSLLRRMKQADMNRASARIERGFQRIERRFLERFPQEQRLFQAGRVRVALSPQQKRLLRELALRELSIDVRFYPAPAQRGYNAARRSFEKMVEFRGPASAPLKRYPKGVDPRHHPDWHIQFGFESEYTLRDAEKLLTVYGPARGFGMSKARWLGLTHEARVTWLKENMQRLFPYDRVEGGLVKLVKDEELAFLPERLIKDSTGNLEIVLKPFDTFEDWYSRVTLLNERLGTGSMQATVSSPTGVFFGGNGARGRELQASVEENLGYFTLMSDFDALQKLEVGAARYAENAARDVARSFNHPFLGPLTRNKQLRLERFLEGNSRGDLLDTDVLGSISGSDASFKYIGGTAYRPDIVPGSRIVQEVRDAHNNMPALVDRMLRLTFYSQYGREPFRGAAALKAFDSVKTFEALPVRVQAMLRRLFPTKTVAGYAYSAEETTALEVFRNFAYPLRDWSAHLNFMGSAKIAGQLRAAQTRYLQRLQRVAADLEAGRITEQEASYRVQGSLAKFSEESTLGDAIRRWQTRNMFADAHWNKYVNLSIHGLDPYRRAFPGTIWEGALESRLVRLAQKWPKNVHLVDDVRFQYRPTREFASRRVVAITRSGLTQQQQRELTQDYVNAVARGTISFPLAERADHLYTRIGTRVVDSYSWANEASYGWSGNRRLEPLMVVTPDEELRLRFYVENVLRNKNGTLGGGANMDGVASARTRGTMRNNRPVKRGERHNCTSWVCTAPVGESAEKSLMDLAGAPASWEVHTSPQWWPHFLTGASPRDRVPVVVYWSDKTMGALKRSVRSGKEFPAWDFGI